MDLNEMVPGARVCHGQQAAAVCGGGGFFLGL